MIPWGLLGTATGAIETFVQFALKAGWSNQQIIEVLQEHLNPEMFASIIQHIMEELSMDISMIILGF